MKSKYWSLLRAIAQFIFFVLFITSIIYLHDPLSDVATGFFPSLSAHIVAISYLLGYSVRYAIIAVVICIGTLVFGRFFCGWICPLGASIDASDTICTTNKKKSLDTSFSRIKFLVILGSVCTGILGLNVAGFIDPITIAYRSYELFFYPFISYIGSEPLSWIFPGFSARDNPIYYFNWFIVAVIFFTILALSRRARRFWCRTICPLGAIYAILSHFSFLRRVVDRDKCVGCNACVHNCRMGAIISGGMDTIEHECIKCFECLKVCNYDAISFRFIAPVKFESVERPGKHITRKDALIVFGSSIMVASAKLTGFASFIDSSLLRPPGALKEEKFLDACIRCGQCMNVCPTNALHPCFVEAGLYGMFTPRLIPRVGYCDFNCTRCGSVCPTGAIRKLSLKEKQRTIVGTAYIVKDVCIPWSEAKNCIVCEEVCPVEKKAITLEKRFAFNKEGVLVEVLLPIVHGDRCIGCGICENKCPVNGQSAIIVRKPKLAN